MGLTFAEDVDDNAEQHLVQHDHMLSNTVQFGMVVEAEKDDPTPPKGLATVLVHIGGKEKGSFTRNWMPWMTQRAGYDAEWWMPELNEQVVVLAPSGDLKQGVVLGTLFHGEWMNPGEADKDFSKAPPATQKIPQQQAMKQHKRCYQDGTSQIYDKSEHKLSLEIKEKFEDEEPGIAASLLLKEKAATLLLNLGAKQGEQTSLSSTDKDFTLLSQDEIRMALETPLFQIHKDDGITLQIGGVQITLHEDDGIKIDADGVSATLHKDDGIKLEAGGSSIVISDADGIVIDGGGSTLELTQQEAVLSSTSVTLDGGTTLVVDSSGAEVT